MHCVERLPGCAAQAVRVDGSDPARFAGRARLFHRFQHRASCRVRLRKMQIALRVARWHHVRDVALASLPAGLRSSCLLRLLPVLGRRHDGFDAHRNHERVSPRTMRTARLFLLGAWLLPALAFGETEAAPGERHVVVLVWDGMRPDFVSERNTPTLWKLAQEGVTFAHHHSVYVSATNVNGAAIATGVY